MIPIPEKWLVSRDNMSHLFYDTVSTTVKLSKKYYVLTSFLPTLCNLNLKKYHHHRRRSLSPTAWLYGINNRHPQEPLRDGLVDVAVEGFY